MKKSKIVGILLTVMVLGVVFTKSVVVAAENDIIPNYPSEVLTGEKIIDLSDQSLTVGGIFSKILPYIYTIAGLILLFMLIAGGLGLMTAAGDPKKVEGSQKRITMALVGFLIVFISYIVVQLVGVMLGMDLLGGGNTMVNSDSAAQEVEITIFNSDGDIINQETKEIDDEYDPESEPCEDYSYSDCPSWCSTYDGTCIDNQ